MRADKIHHKGHKGHKKECCRRLIRTQTHASRKAEVMGSLAGPKPGSRPPMMPMVTANIRPLRMSREVMWKAKAISLKLGPPTPATTPFMGKASRQPSKPPVRARKIASNTKAKRMLKREKPR